MLIERVLTEISNQRLAIDVFIQGHHWQLAGTRPSSQNQNSFLHVSDTLWCSWSILDTTFSKSEMANCLISSWSIFISHPSPPLRVLDTNNSITFLMLPLGPYCNGWRRLLEMLSHLNQNAMCAKPVYLYIMEISSNMCKWSSILQTRIIIFHHFNLKWNEAVEKVILLL